jgi:proteasome assembly chaperone (PAC2) family protein
MAFEGWNDAGDAASTAARHIVNRFNATPFAEIDPEPFYDFTDTRPLVHLENGERVITWPQNEFFAATIDGAERDLIVLLGLEPQLRWRTYSEQIVRLATELGCELVISLGALIADVAHSRPTTIYGSTDNPLLGSKLELEPSTYEGPTGIVGVVHNAIQTEGIDSASLWAAVPSYVPHANSPKAALALVDRLAQIIEIPILGGPLVEASADYESQITALVGEDDDTQAYVASLEAQYDASMSPESGAALIEELEQFLKEQPDT